MPVSRRWSWSTPISPTSGCRPHRLGRPAGAPDPAAGGREQLSGHGVYYQRAASADPKSRLIELRLKPEAGRFIIGSPVRVALPLAEQQTMLLPRDALVLNTEGAWSIRWSSAARS